MLCLLVRHESAANVLVFFVVQVLSSLIMMLLVLVGVPIAWAVVLPIVIKLGIAPFHGWFVALCSTGSKSGLAYIIVLQKVPVVMVLFIVCDGGTCLLLGVIGLANIMYGLNMVWLCSFDMRSVLGYSSLAYFGWVITAGVVGVKLGLLFLMLYCLVAMALLACLGSS